MILITITILIAATYAIWTILVLLGWKKYVGQTKSEAVTVNSISIVIPFRNEERNLPAIINSIETLTYPKQNFEVLFVDDHSTDCSVEVLERLTEHSRVDISIHKSTNNGKKSAQSWGIHSSKHNWIACTDADCVVPQNWLHDINDAIQRHDVKLVFGGVLINSKEHSLQKLEFLALIGSTMSMLKRGWLVMGNAANMAVKKDEFLKVERNLNNTVSPSGDDVFLLHELGKTPNSIALLSGAESAVKTNPQVSISELFFQRIRWASKTKKYQSTHAVIIAILIFAVNAFLLILGLSVFFNLKNGPLLVGLVFVKWFCDYYMLSKFTSFYKQEFALKTFFIQELINVIYVPIVGIFSQIISFSWKGRKY